METEQPRNMIKHDCNGGFVIQKGTFAMIMAIIAMLSVIGTVIATGVSLKSDVDYLKQQYSDAGPRHTATIDKIQNHVQENSERAMVNAERIANMQCDISEIKSDVKKLLGENKG